MNKHLKAAKEAHKQQKENEQDYSLIAWMLRDTEIVKEAGLVDL